jgi:NAD(P)-dependent dehydrogenase (short-subunit alcohol dehydrogenase family)
LWLPAADVGGLAALVTAPGDGRSSHGLGALPPGKGKIRWRVEHKRIVSGIGARVIVENHSIWLPGSRRSSRHAIIGPTRSLAVEGAPFGVAVTAVAPGPAQTAMLDRVIGGDADARPHL